MQAFKTLPDDAHVWIYVADGDLADEDIRVLEQSLSALITSWSSHGKSVHGAWSIEADRIVILAAHVSEGTLSGCGIDKSLHALQDVARDRSFSWVDGLTIVYRSPNGSVQTCSRSDFRQMTASGEVHSATPVVPVHHENLGALRENGLECPAGTSWHGRVFNLLKPSEIERVQAETS